MKKYIFLLAGISIFALGVSAAHAQFAVGDRVQTTSYVNVRSIPSTASGTVIGIQSIGAFGTVLGGPTVADGYTWWNINYDVPPDGWSAGNYLAKITTPNCGDVNKDGAADVFDLNLIIGVAFNGATTTYVTDVNGSGATDVFDVNQEIDYLFSGGAEPTGCVARNQSPSAIISGPSAVVVGSPATWSVSAFDPNGDAMTMTISWGDGSSPSLPIAINSGETKSITHVYTQVSSFMSITASISDGKGGIGTASSMTFKVTVPQPTIGSFIGPSSATTGQNTSWQVSATDTNIIWYYKFNWGDGTPLTTIYTSTSSNSVSASHIFNSVGLYNVVVTVVNVQNVSASSARVITITTGSVNQPPVINSFMGPSSVIAGTSNTWQAQATDPNGDPLTYVFNWGNGSPSSTLSQSSGVSVSVNKIYFYPGTYTQTLQVWDTPYSGWTSQTRSLIVTASSTSSSTTPNQPPVINSFTGPTSALPNTWTSWPALATDPEGGVLHYVVNWGDGTPASSTYANSGVAVNYWHVFSNPGTYTANLNVSDAGGLSASSNWSISVGATTSSAPMPKTIYPAPTTSPKTLTPIAASTIDSMRAQLDAIAQQLQYLLMQIR